MKSSRFIFSEISQKYPIIPFCARALEEKRAQLGLVECVNHDLLQPYPILHEKPGKYHCLCLILLLKQRYGASPEIDPGHRCIFREVESGDLIAYGLIQEFVGRFPIIASLSGFNSGDNIPDDLIDVPSEVSKPIASAQENYTEDEMIDTQVREPLRKQDEEVEANLFIEKIGNTNSDIKNEKFSKFEID
ncbi:hypothetical protein KSP39_PZI001169 [Platanthera zijinensis]|uniref:Uncharacterized protein n=1 Tax=Platanthera zijinensis TaxID=2320716 RepID=A0AAP0C045_9ASPA